MPKDWKLLIRDEVLPAWVDYLSHKRSKEVANNEFAEIRTDTVAKKIIRDLKAFYVILWKKRFGHVFVKSNKQLTILLKTLFADLNISEHFVEDQVDIYGYFFSCSNEYILKMKEQCNAKSDKKKKDVCMNVFYNYNVLDRDHFLSHPVFSRFFCLVFYTFFPVYESKMKEEFTDPMISEVLNIFRVIIDSMTRSGPDGAEISKKDKMSFFEISQKLEHSQS